MKYQKPEILPFGSATLLIQGRKSGPSEISQPMKQAFIGDGDLDD